MLCGLFVTLNLFLLDVCVQWCYVSDYSGAGGFAKFGRCCVVS